MKLLSDINYSILIITTVIILGISLTGRFKFHTTSPDILQKIKNKMKWKRIYRIHHIFIGAIILIIGLTIESIGTISFASGVALSDILHHATLKITTGNAEFHLTDNKFI